MRHLLQPHPDIEFLARVRAALDHWEAEAPPTPTSSVLGGGAIEAAEAEFGRRHGGRRALLLPSASYAVRIGLMVLGVEPGSEVICPVIDWSAGFAAIASLGAVPVTARVHPATLTLDPLAARQMLTDRTRAVLACHLHGVCADIPALRQELPGVPILEDAAQAFGCSLDGRPAGTHGDVAVLSLGPGKQIDAGEGGVLLCGDGGRYDAAVGLACHPLRQLLSGAPEPGRPVLVMRPHPLAAIMALHQLTSWNAESPLAARAATLRRLNTARGLRVVGADSRRTSSQPYVPVVLEAGRVAPPRGLRWSPSGAQVLPHPAPSVRRQAEELLARVRIAACAAPSAKVLRDHRKAEG